MFVFMALQVGGRDMSLKRVVEIRQSKALKFSRLNPSQNTQYIKTLHTYIYIYICQDLHSLCM